MVTVTDCKNQKCSFQLILSVHVWMLIRQRCLLPLLPSSFFDEMNEWTFKYLLIVIVKKDIEALLTEFLYGSSINWMNSCVSLFNVREMKGDYVLLCISLTRSIEFLR